MNVFRILLILLLILLALVLGLTALMFHGLFYKPKRSKKVPKSYQDTPHYKVSRAGMALMDHLPVEDHHITSRDGLLLHAYLYPVEGERKKFLLGIHGYKSYARPEFGPYIAFYQAQGYSLLLPDLRAHGPSQGDYIGFGVLDRLDPVDWAKYLVETYGEDVEILLHGVSMGAATVLAASGEGELPSQVRGITADCGYASLKEEFSYQLKTSVHLPRFPFLPLLQGMAKRKLGYDFSEFSPIEQVKRAKVPILFVQGGKDPMVPASMARELYEACAAPKRLLLVEEAGHAESICFAMREYEEALLQLLRGELKGEAEEDVLSEQSV